MREREIVITVSGAVLGALITLTPFNLFPVCTDLVTTAAGTMIPMACFWTGRFAVALGILTVIFSVLIYPIKDPMARRVNSGFLAVLGATTILLAGGYISRWCMAPAHPCRAQTAPTLTVLGLALLIVGIVAVLVVRRPMTNQVSEKDSKFLLKSKLPIRPTKKRLIALTISFILMFSITIGAGIYAADFGANEIIHFWIAVPAGRITEPITAKGAGPPIALRPIVIDLEERGVLKNLIQPNVEALSSHWIYNLGTKPVRIRMELVNCTIPVKWEVRANFPYDPQTHTFTEPLMPSKSIPDLGIDWVFDIPDEFMRNQLPPEGAILYNGGLRLVNADTGAELTFIPIVMGRGISSIPMEVLCH